MSDMQKASCHQRCRYDRLCYYEGADRDDFPDECAQYYHIEDILADAEDILEEQRKARGDDFE